MHRHRISIASLIVSVLAGFARADEPANGEKKPESPTLKLTLHAMKPPYAAMKYRLLPKYIDQTSGNAAPQYMRAALRWESVKRYQDLRDKIADWDKLPLAELIKNSEATSFYDSTPTGDWDLIRLAAHKEHCEWDLPLRENNFATLIPELQKVRDLGQLIAFKARIEMARGQLGQAIDSLQTGFAMARHAAEAPTLINGMVGIAIARIMASEVDELVQQPNCPNLYWSLSALPQPLVDLRRGLEMEQDSIYLAFPELREVRTAKHASAEWDHLLLDFSSHLMTLIPEVTGGEGAKKNIGWWATAGYFAITAYPKAKAQLLDAGFSQTKIDAMPSSQAVLLAIVETYDKQRDEIHKWYYVPTPQMQASALSQAMKQIDDSSEIVPLAKVLMPAINSVVVGDACLRREVAALEVVEAIRLYAAEHENKLPNSLAEITEVPLPLDPVTGKAFEYSFSGKSAILQSPAPLNKPERNLCWELEMVAAK